MTGLGFSMVTMCPASGISFKDAFASEQSSRKRLGILVAILVIFSTIPVSYVFLSYTGDLGYTCTKDVVCYLSSDNREEIVVLNPGRYDPQLRWYSERSGSNIEVVGRLPNDLSSVSVADLRNLSGSIDASEIYLVIDGRGGLEERLESVGYERVYDTYYWTKLPSLFSEIYTGEESGSKYFEQHLSVYRLR